jgi:hypothetical protein
VHDRDEKFILILAGITERKKLLVRRCVDIRIDRKETGCLDVVFTILAQHKFQTLGYFDLGTEPRTSLKGREFFGRLKDYQLLKRDCALWS